MGYAGQTSLSFTRLCPPSLPLAPSSSASRSQAQMTSDNCCDTFISLPSHQSWSAILRQVCTQSTRYLHTWNQREMVSAQVKKLYMLGQVRYIFFQMLFTQLQLKNTKEGKTAVLKARKILAFQTYLLHDLYKQHQCDET